MPLLLSLFNLLRRVMLGLPWEEVSLIGKGSWFLQVEPYSCFNYSQRSSQETAATTASRGSTSTLCMPVSELEKRLKTDRTLDIFTMRPKVRFILDDFAEDWNPLRPSLCIWILHNSPLWEKWSSLAMLSSGSLLDIQRKRLSTIGDMFSCSLICSWFVKGCHLKNRARMKDRGQTCGYVIHPLLERFFVWLTSKAEVSLLWFRRFFAYVSWFRQCSSSCHYAKRISDVRITICRHLQCIEQVLERVYRVLIFLWVRIRA